MLNLVVIAKEFAEYPNQWIAIDERENRIVAVADNIFDASKNAETGGYPDATLYRVPPPDILFAPAAGA